MSSCDCRTYPLQLQMVRLHAKGTTPSNSRRIFLVNVVFAHVFLMMLDIHASTHFTSLFQLTSCFGAELRGAAIKANIAQIRL